VTDELPSNEPVGPWEVQFTRLPDGGVEFVIPDDVAHALGWREGDLIELDFDANGRLVGHKIDNATTEVP